MTKAAACLVGLALLLTLAGHGSGQETTRIEEDVLVTATRIPKAASAAGQSVSVVTAKEVWDRQAIDAAEAIRVVPGVYVSRSGPPGSPTSVYLRGAASNQTVVLVDGVKVNDPTIGGQFNFYDLEFANAQGVEVMRGSQSTLHGSDAIGGVVNVVSRSGESAPGGRGVIEGGTFGYLHSAAGGWYGEQAIEVSLDVSGTAWDNDVSNNEYRGETFAGRLGGRNPDGLGLSLAGRYWKSKAEDPYDYPFGQVIEEDDNIRRKRETWLGRFELSQDPKEGIGWSAYTTYFDVDSEFRNGPDAKGEKAELDSDARGMRQTYGASVTVTDAALAESSNAVLLVGAEYEVEDSESESRSWDTTNQIWFRSEVEGTVRNRSGFGHLDLSFGEYLTVGGGYRYDKNDVFGSASTWSASGLLSLGEIGTRIRANFGQGIRAPRPVEFSDPFVGNRDLQEERSNSYDLGWEQSLFEELLVFSVTWFRLDTDDLIAYDASTGRLENFQSTRTQGFELNARASPIEGLLLSGFFTVQDPKNLDAGPGEEDQLPGRPTWFGGGTVEFGLADFVAGLDLYASTDYPDTGKIDPDGRRRDHPGRKFLLTFRTAYDVGKGGKIVARVENLLDDEYYDSEVGPMGLGIGFYGGLAWEF